MAQDQEKGEIDLSNGEPIGGGGFGDVYKFADGNEFFALKVPKYEEDAVKRKKQSAEFIKECQKLIQIKHPNVVIYFGVVDVNDKYGKKAGIKMEFCERGSLKDLIFNRTIIYSMTNISIWAEQLFGALVFIFDEHKIVHHDIKAENIFVTADFSLKLGDFGLFKESDGTRSGTYDGGTPRYKSPPEIPDPKKPNETLPKLSHKNDVYSMGLVLWELVERRVVLSEFDAYGDGFDYPRFYVTVYLQKLSHVEGPTCSGPMGDIVQKCTRFQRRKRPEASDILEEIKSLTQANGESNQVKEDLNEERLIRPIGFNGGTDRQPIDNPLRMAEVSEIVKEYHMNPWHPEWRKRVDSFVHKFNSLNPEERSKFVHNIPNLVAKVLENKKIHFHEAWSHLTRLRLDDTWTNHPLEDLFQAIIELNQRETERDIAQYLDLYLDPNKWPLIKFFEYSRLIERLEELGSRLRSTTFYFRAFLSTETLQVWLLLRDESWEVSFIRDDFQSEVPEGKWMNTEKSKCRVGEDDLHYLKDQEIDFHQMPKKIKKQEELLVFQARIFLNQLVPLDESQKRTESISVPNIGYQGLPVKNYLFQLRNPPRTDCKHHPKCSIFKYSIFEGELKEMGIPYYSCSSDKSLQYLKEWWDFCTRYLNNPRVLFPSDAGEITGDSFILIQFKRDNQYYTLLDHPNNYEDHELIYYHDERRKRHKMESSKIRKLLDEMAPEMRRYAVVTRWQIFAIYQEENRLPWSLKESKSESESESESE